MPIAVPDVMALTTNVVANVLDAEDMMLDVFGGEQSFDYHVKIN